MSIFSHFKHLVAQLILTTTDIYYGVDSFTLNEWPYALHVVVYTELILRMAYFKIRTE